MATATIYSIRPTYARNLSIEKIQKRLASSFNVLDNGCWQWSKGKYPTGYGRISLWGRPPKGGQFMAHRVLYELIYGTQPENMQIDHLCRKRDCVNPMHMEVVSKDENNIRGNSPSAIHSRKTHCPQGHEYTLENTGYWSNGPGKVKSRNCKACNRVKCIEYSKNNKRGNK